MYDLTYLNDFTSDVIFKDYFLKTFEIAFLMFVVIWFICWGINSIWVFFRKVSSSR